MAPPQNRRQFLMQTGVLLPASASGLANAVTTVTSNGDLAAEQGLAALDRGNFSQAIVLFEDALLKGLNTVMDALIWESLAHAHLGLYDTDGATESCQRWTIAMPQDPSAWLNFGTMLSHTGRFDEADACYLRAEPLGPDRAEFHACKGALHLYRDEAHEALTELDVALKVNPAHPYVHSNRAIAFAMLSRFEDAWHAYRQAVITGYEKPAYLKSRLEAFQALVVNEAGAT